MERGREGLLHSLKYRNGPNSTAWHLSVKWKSDPDCPLVLTSHHNDPAVCFLLPLII